MTGDYLLETVYDEDGCPEYIPRRVSRGETLRAVVTDYAAPIKPDLGTHFTEAEERAISRACAGAREFMKNYGKGRAPIEVDRRHYFRGVAPIPAPEESHTEANENENEEEVQTDAQAGE